jgi:hypothetical protein
MPNFFRNCGVIDKANPPCVVFFKLKNDRLEDIATAQLDAADLIHGFHELYGVIEQYIKSDMSEVGIGLRSLLWLKSSSKFIASEVFKAALTKALDDIFRT